MSNREAEPAATTATTRANSRAACRERALMWTYKAEQAVERLRGTSVAAAANATAIPMLGVQLAHVWATLALSATEP